MVQLALINLPIQLVECFDFATGIIGHDIIFRDTGYPPEAPFRRPSRADKGLLQIGAQFRISVETQLAGKADHTCRMNARPLGEIACGEECAVCLIGEQNTKNALIGSGQTAFVFMDDTFAVPSASGSRRWVTALMHMSAIVNHFMQRI